MLKRSPKQKTDQVVEMPIDPSPDDLESPASENNPTTPSDARQNELERLRDILYGSQSRATEQRMSDLEARSARLHQELLDTLSERLEALSTSFNNQITALRSEFNDRVAQESGQQSTALQSAQREFNTRLDFQQKENTENLQVVQRSLSERLDKLTADTNQQMQNMQRDLSERINQTSSDQTERARNNQNETRQRIENLREELNHISNLLSGQKISRDELGMLLLELSHRLQREQ